MLTHTKFICIYIYIYVLVIHVYTLNHTLTCKHRPRLQVAQAPINSKSPHLLIQRTKTTRNPQGNIMHYIWPSLIPTLATIQYLLILIAFSYGLAPPTTVYGWTGGRRRLTTPKHSFFVGDCFCIPKPCLRLNRLPLVSVFAKNTCLFSKGLFLSGFVNIC